MSYRVHVQPSGRWFEAQEKETLLEAGLRAGLNLSHSCSTGSCGLCRARLLGGRIRRVRHSDFIFPEPEKSQGWFLTCCNCPEADLEIEAAEATSTSDIPIQEIAAKVTRLERLNAWVMLLHLRTPRTQHLRFMAGQYVSLVSNGLESRKKFIASCPCDSLRLRFHIRYTPGHPFSEFAFDQLRVGDRVVVRGPWGNFTLNDKSTRPILFIAHETGFAAVESLMEHAIALELDQPLWVYWLVSSTAGHYRINYLRSWKDALDNFDYRCLRLGSDEIREFNHALLGLIEAHQPLRRYDVYITAPERNRGSVRKIFQNEGLPPPQLRIDDLEHA